MVLDELFKNSSEILTPILNNLRNKPYPGDHPIYLKIKFLLIKIFFIRNLISNKKINTYFESDLERLGNLIHIKLKNWYENVIIFLAFSVL